VLEIIILTVEITTGMIYKRDVHMYMQIMTVEVQSLSFLSTFKLLSL